MLYFCLGIAKEQKLMKIKSNSNHWGTAVNIQAMVWKYGDDCSTGVAFTRNPSTGENSIFGEFLLNAQGEDVVAGTRTPQYITKKAKQDRVQRSFNGRGYA